MSKPTSVSIGGMDGAILDVAMRPGWINTCSNSGAPEGTVGVVYDTPGWTFAGPDDNAGQYPNPMLGLIGDERARYVLLDRGSDRSLVIAVKATDATCEATMAATMPIIESFEFAP